MIIFVFRGFGIVLDDSEDSGHGVAPAFVFEVVGDEGEAGFALLILDLGGEIIGDLIRSPEIILTQGWNLIGVVDVEGLEISH